MINSCPHPDSSNSGTHPQVFLFLVQFAVDTLQSLLTLATKVYNLILDSIAYTGTLDLLLAATTGDWGLSCPFGF